VLDVVFRGVKVDLETNQTGYVLRLHLVAKFNFDVGRCGDQNNFSLDLGVCVWVMISFNIACRLLIIDLTCICYYARPQQRWRSIVMSTSVCVCVCVSVCVSVCLSVCEHISPEALARFLPNFSCMLPITVARSSSFEVTQSQGKHAILRIFFPVEHALYGPYTGMNFATISLKFTSLS